MKILSPAQVARKIKRLAIEIHANHIEDKELYFAGINDKGLKFATIVSDELSNISQIKIHRFGIKLNPAEPLIKEIEATLDIKSLEGSKIILFDDVANTGRTFFYACKPFLSIIPSKLETAALIDRKHKSFPVHIDYVGLSLATTLHDNIEVIFKENNVVEAFLG
jgi:pyrimidine operon attenuation protein/uracil phosphoribosyltransferase